MAIGAILSAAASQAGSFGLTNSLQRATAQLANVSWPNVLPTPEQIFQAFLAGTMRHGDARNALALHGITAPLVLQPNDVARTDPGEVALQRLWTSVYDAGLTVPAPGELLVLLNRRPEWRPRVLNWLKRSGYVEPEVIDALDVLRTQIPTPSDIITLAVKEAWDEDVVRRFGYDLEYPSQVEYWLAAGGMAGESRSPQDIAAGKPNVSWAQRYWRSHWQTLAPGQMFEMFQRLRPNRVARWAGSIPNLAPFVWEDLQTGLKVNDYPQPYRPWLAALAYNVPRLVDIQRYYDLGVIDRNELNELHLDRGYTPADAEARTQFVDVSFRKRIAASIGWKPKATILKAYKLGALTQAAAAVQLYVTAVRFTRLEREFLALAPVAQQAAALANQTIVGMLDQVDMDLQLERINNVVKTERKRFLKGQHNSQQALAILQRTGMDLSRAGELVAAWEDERSGSRLMFSTAQIQRYYGMGLLPAAVAGEWLGNLGWHQPELQMILNKGTQDLLRLRDREEDKRLRTAKQLAADRAKQLKELDAQRKRVIQTMRDQASASQLTKYLKAGVITPADFARDMRARGYTDERISADLRLAGVESTLGGTNGA